MNIVVCLHAPPPDPAGSGLGRDDAHALAQALALAEAGQDSVTAVLAGTSHESGPLQRALVAGVTRAVRIGGDDYASVDFHTLGQALAAGIKRIGADLVLTGARSDDEGLGAVPASTARHLGFPYISGVEALSAAGPRAVGIVVRGGGRKRRLRVELPAVLAIVAGPNGLPAPSESHREPQRGRAVDARRPRSHRRAPPHRAPRQTRAGVAGDGGSDVGVGVIEC